MNKTAMGYFGLAFVTIIITIFYYNCANSGKLLPDQIIHRDTSRILGCFVDFKSKGISFDVMYMIVKDTSVFKNVDSSTQKKKWEKDTAFFIPMKSIDTLKKTPDYIQVMQQSVSIERNFDSAVSTLSKWVKDHPQYFPSPPVIVPGAKKDSTSKFDSTIKSAANKNKKP